MNKTITYKELANRVGDMVMMNNITESDEFWFENLTNGELWYCITHDECDEMQDDCDTSSSNEIYQWYAITGDGAKYLENNTNEIVYYNEKLDTHFWGIQHWGTSWDYVSVEVSE